MGQCLRTTSHFLQKGQKIYAAEIFGILRKVPGAARQQRLRPYLVAGGMVVQAYRDLYQALEELLLFERSGPPNVLPDFVGVEEVGLIEQLQASVKSLRVHAPILAQMVEGFVASLQLSIEIWMVLYVFQ